MRARSSLVLIAAACLLAPCAAVRAGEFHVAPGGDDAAPGTKAAPLRTIQRAADLAQPGDVITVHAGTYRERINPPRGGLSDKERIVYRAAPGEKVEIKGSEVVKGWVKAENDAWKAVLPDSFFGGFNPYADLIRGDWFDPRGREHHTGAVYLDGEWLIEATKLEEVLSPADAPPAWLGGAGTQYLLNVAWLRPGGAAQNLPRIPATKSAARHGTQDADCSEGGRCVGWIAHGDWLRYEGVDFGAKTEQIEIRAASASTGGVIELRLDGPEGELLGTCTVPNTGDWQSWSSFTPAIKAVSGVKTLCLVFKSRTPAAGRNPGLWFARVDGAATTIWAQFKDADPNERLVEINVRRTVFYPDKPGRDFITVRGFALRHAATPWAPPTAEQIGLVGTHWSKGWVIEDNAVSHSTCSGIALGKHGDEWDNTSANSAEGYVKTIERALARGWHKDAIGRHVVRNNTISHCEQAGVVGSLGAAFSTVEGNEIHDIHVRRLFSGAEMAGIKFHAAIDTVIRNNHIHRTCLGLWLDWMAQGTRVSANLLHDNAGQDLFVEVDHGPFVVDNNLFLSPVSLLDMSEGGAYAHNLFGGRIISRPEPGRETPYHPAHSTAVAGLTTIKGGDDRFYNNIFAGAGGPAAGGGARTDKDPAWAGGYGLWVYDWRPLPLATGGNVYVHGAQPYGKEEKAVVLEKLDPQLRLASENGEVALSVAFEQAPANPGAVLVTTELLGKAKIPDLPYENADGSPLRVDADYFGATRSAANPTPGPFEGLGAGLRVLKVMTPRAAGATYAGPWNMTELGKAPRADWGAPSGVLRQVFYEGEPLDGKPTRVFAYVAVPDWGAAPFPGMVLVHGGGGKAFPEWAALWARRGYAAIAMDLGGCGPDGQRLPDGMPGQGDEIKFRPFAEGEAASMWTYHAVAAVIRGHSLLRACKEVDPQRTGVTGISWGGYLTCIAAGIDDRFKAAVPVYGCGFLHENSCWLGWFEKLGPEQARRWVERFDPSRYLSGVACPILFANGTNDFAYPLDSYRASYRLVKTPVAIRIEVRMPHGHPQGWAPQEIGIFADSNLRGGDPLAALGPLVETGGRASAKFVARVPVVRGQLHYTAGTGKWQDRAWESRDAQLDGDSVAAELPAARPLVYYLSVTDVRGAMVSTAHAELP